ncbi:MAG: sensor histidine kinase [Nonomuraea sp.]|nr:sensor histidine kinase [Nonomuraea sp.]NUP67392.1 sensor histidine kinase [Nonomuraea sp.]NUP83365.1 sensor histidine kinase [Nonomuraea sp.]NUT11125.1 sensor histidine kinase [Nonomuraea sp.]
MGVRTHGGDRGGAPRVRRAGRAGAAPGQRSDRLLERKKERQGDGFPFPAVCRAGIARGRAVLHVRRQGRRSLARQVLILQTTIIGTLVAIGVVLVYADEARARERDARDSVTAVAATVADMPAIRLALESRDADGTLQKVAERVRADTRVDFITIMDREGRRYTHPNPKQIGGRYIGSTAQALAGRMFTEKYVGTLGESVRTIAPIFDEDHHVVGMVSAGITVKAISEQAQRRLGLLLTIGAGILCVGLLGSSLVSRRVRQQTRGMAPAELRQMFDYYESTLHAFREGLLLVSPDGTITLCNSAGRHLLEFPDPLPASVDRLGLPEELAVYLVDTEPHADVIHVARSRVLVMNTAPVHSRGKFMGNAVTFRDHTELLALAGELDSTRRMADGLRAHAHEAANRLHTVVSLVGLGHPERAVEFATSNMRATQALTDRVVNAISEPVVAALLLGKSAEANERGVGLVVVDDAEWDGNSPIDPRDLVTILGNLIDNAVDAGASAADQHGEPPTVWVTLYAENDDLLIEVADTGPGVDPDALPTLTQRDWTTKPDDARLGRGVGLALVSQIVRKYGGQLTVRREIGAVFSVRLPQGGAQS